MKPRFEIILDSVLSEYQLSGGNWGQQPKKDFSSRKALNMQPVAKLSQTNRLKNLEQTVPPATEEGSIPVRLPYSVYVVFQQYWEGQNDPLYAILSRRGDSVDWVTVYATSDEIDRLAAVAEHILMNSEDRGEIATAQQLKDQLEESL